MTSNFKRWTALATLLLGLGGWSWAQGNDTVASLDRLAGRVEVIKGDTGDVLQGRNGLLLRVGDTVVTQGETRVTIKFRDGSEVRMFPNSRFIIQNIKEAPSQTRSFSYKLFLKLGALWGRFVPQRQVATIGMPAATIGIKGTTLRAAQGEKTGRVSLTEGKIDVSNDRSTVELVPGKLLRDFTRNQDLATKVEDIPYEIDIKSEKQQLTFPGGQPEEVFVSLQLIDIKTGSEVHRAGRLYFRSDYERIAYPPVADLNQRGFTRVPLVISPPEVTDEKLDGNIYVWALIDEDVGDDTVEGRILFTFPVSGAKERIRVEADSGEGKRMK